MHFKHFTVQNILKIEIHLENVKEKQTNKQTSKQKLLMLQRS